MTGTPAEASEEMTEEEVNASPSKLSPNKGTPAQSVADGETQQPRRPIYMLQHHPSQLDLKQDALSLGDRKHKRYPIQATKVEGYPGAGMGRIVRLSEPVALTDIIDRIALGLGNPKGFPIAVPQGKEASDMMIKSIGICAGSGGHLFSEMEANGEEVDLLFTGELSHHEALAAIEKGKCVICLFHSNTERGFLHSVLKGQLDVAIKEEVSKQPIHTYLTRLTCLQWEKIRNEERAKDGNGEEFLDALNDEHVEVHVSEFDRDPYGVMISKEEI